MSEQHVGQYYEKLQATPIGELARELLNGRITHEGGTELECDCPNHESASKRSLKIDLATNRWHCWGCGVGGAPLQLVEFIRFGACSTKQRGRMPESHREARTFLATRCGMPPLEQVGKTKKEIAQAEQAYQQKEACFEALAVLAEYFHQNLLRDDTTLAWLQTNYGLTLETITQLKIGFADYEGESTIKHLMELHHIDRLAALGTGLFGLSENNSAWPVLKDRVVFPYWKGGRIVSMVGRVLPWAKDKTQPKYKKLFVHHPEKRPYVRMDNSAFYNEDCLLKKPEAILITEGVTDCIAAYQKGIPVISPVTVQFRDRDIPRLASVLRNCKRIFLCLDNELSNVGMKGALKLAKQLEKHGLYVRIATLPLEAEQIEAREKLARDFGIKTDLDNKTLKTKIPNPTLERVAEARQLIAATKIDLNAYFAKGHTLEEFKDVLNAAKPRVEILIGQLDTSLGDQARYEQRKPLMLEIAKLPEYYLDRCLKLIQQHYGKRSITISALRSELREASKAFKKEIQTNAKQQLVREKLKEAKPNTCREAMLEYELQALDGGSVSHEGLGKVVADWFKANGARFFYSPGEEPIMFFQGHMYHLASSNKGVRRDFLSFFQSQTHLTHITAKGRVVLETLRNTARQEGLESEPKTWLHTIPKRHTVYFNLNNERSEVARITPDGVEIFKNGDNPDDVVLRGQKRMSAINFIPDADLKEAKRLMDEIILRNLACSELDRCFIVTWISCFLLIGYVGNRPMTRFEGRYGSGKTGASKVITTLIYGQPQNKKSTMAANYADAARNPLTSLDNLEVQNMTQELSDFLLLATSGVSREKVAYGTDSELITDVAHCLINSTGIEPLNAALGEILSRAFTIRFTRKHRRKGFLEVETLANIQQHRDLILSALMKRTARVLGLIKAGQHSAVMHLLEDLMGDHNKSRCNDYLSLMYLMILSAEEPEDVGPKLQELTEPFCAMVNNFNKETETAGAEGNPIGQALTHLFRAYQKALEADELKNTRMSEAAFREKYLITFDTPTRIKNILARDLMASLKRASREYGEPLPYQNALQFGVRFRADERMIEKAGFKITSAVRASNKRYYTIEQIGVENDALD